MRHPLILLAILLFAQGLSAQMGMGKPKEIKFDGVKRRDADPLLKAHLHDTFSQIKRT